MFYSHNKVFNSSSMTLFPKCMLGLWSILTAVPAEVTRQNRRIVGHHACGPHIQRIFNVFIRVAHKQMHLQRIVCDLSML